MRRALAAALLAAAMAPAGAAAAPRVSVMVVGRGGELLEGPARVAMKTRTARVRGRACPVGARTPLSALLSLRLKLTLRDYGSCGASVRDSSGLYVVGVNAQRERGRGGWVYKPGRRTPDIGAADPAQRLRDRSRVWWFWCEQDSSGGCQRTLEVRPERTGDRVRVVVRGYDDRGRGRLIAGATVHMGDVTATTGADGVAVLAAPAGAARVHASKKGLVRSFPVRVP